MPYQQETGLMFGSSVLALKKVQQIVEAISSQQLTRKCNKFRVIPSCRDKNISITNIQENRSIFNQIRQIQEIGEKLISLPTKPSAPDHIGDVFNIPL